ncbi:MAG: VOC family protein [Alphaproteobacteria bacterium]|nr:VOC family protein [Alphaproteobacteria bacterium]
MISHVSLGTNDIDRARAFYDAVLGTIGLKQVMSFEGAVAYGGEFPEFWVQKPVDGIRPAAASNGTHIAFGAKNRAGVGAFHAAALAAGGEDAGAPGPRPQYGDKYYGAFVIDPDGHKIEAECWGPS